MAVPSALSSAVAVRAVTQSSATTAVSCGTQTRRVIKPDDNVPATHWAAVTPQHSTSSVRNQEEVQHKMFGLHNERSVYRPYTGIEVRWTISYNILKCTQ